MRHRAAAVVTAVLILVTGCSRNAATEPTTHEGSTMTAATPAPGPPPGWEVEEVVPKTHQEARDTVVGYLQRTLAALGPGAVIDASRYLVAGTTSYCDDNDSGPNAPRYFTTLGEITDPAIRDGSQLVEKVGEIWRGWGWYVLEREGWGKPNRFGYTPTGTSCTSRQRPNRGIRHRSRPPHRASPARSPATTCRGCRSCCTPGINGCVLASAINGAARPHHQRATLDGRGREFRRAAEAALQMRHRAVTVATAVPLVLHAGP